MEQLEMAEEKLKEASRLVREAVDLSLEAMCQDNKPDPAISRLWEDFIGEFLKYIQVKGKEKKRNLFAAISFARVWRR